MCNATFKINNYIFLIPTDIKTEYDIICNNKYKNVIYYLIIVI